MFKSLQCILLVASMMLVSLLDGKNIRLTREIDKRREGIIYTVDSEPFYTDGFYVEEDETVYLLKTYENAVLELKRKSRREIPLSAAVLPTDIISDEENLYIFDDILSEVQIYTKQGELLLRSKIELADGYVKGLVKTDNGITVQSYDGQQITVIPESGQQMVQTDIFSPEVDAAMYDCAEYVGTDDERTVYSVHTTLWKDCSIIAGELTLRAVSAEESLLGEYTLPVEEYMYLPGTYIQVLSNGNIYLLVPTERGVEIRKIVLSEKPVSHMDSIAETIEELENSYAAESRYRKKIGTACTTKIELSRDKVMKRVKDMAEYKWTLKRTHTLTSKSESGVVLPREIAALKETNAEKSDWSVQMTGIPYCWGGFNAIDVGAGNRTFQKALNKNYVAGNINSEGYIKYMTAGLDCSGLVSAAFGFTKKESTKGLADIGSKISDVNKLEQMDILVYPGEHIIFFFGWINETTMLVGEAARREGKVVIHPKSLNELVVNGMYQMRSPW